MRRFLTILLLICFLIAASLTAWLYLKLNTRVGDIPKELQTNTSFKICNEKKILQYYGIGTTYEGGKRAIKHALENQLPKDLRFENSGYLVFRFVVNCKGESGRFQVKMTNKELQPTDFDQEKVQQILQHLRKLKNWEPGMRNQVAYDSYCQLTVKVEEGIITDIF
ncbi:hypothetical protein [Ascidiimonas sp. W6]|uniref:hypothetical protein n=1 Tax=Ascidiimonas meishanensis TaxID=3128903 RepID=UPI0030EF8450